MYYYVIEGRGTFSEKFSGSGKSEIKEEITKIGLIRTTSYAMEEAAKNNLEFMVLDRPNPIGGNIIEGPALAPDVSAFTAY